MTYNQIVLLDFLKKVDEICNQNNIEYFIGGGTALGAIRHKGFIPWDDDIDLYIKRDEWVRAKPILKENLGDLFEVVDEEDFPDYNNPIIRIVDKSTTNYARSRLIDGTPHGLQLEFFILDPIPKEELISGSYYSKFWLYAELLSPYIVIANNNLNFEKFPIDIYEYYSDESKLDEKEIFMQKLKDMLFGFEDSECEFYHLRWGINWVIFPKKAFDERIWVEFEDYKLPIAKGYTDVLFGEYGFNWMQIPSINNQITHSTIENYNISYEEYEKIISKHIDYSKSKKAYASRKKNVLFNAIYKKRKERIILNYEKRIIEIKFMQEGDLRNNILEAYDNELYNVVEHLLQKYYELQEKAFSSFVFVDLDDTLFEIAIKTKLINGDLRFIEKIRRIISMSNIECPLVINEMFETADEIRNIYYAQYNSDISVCEENVDCILERYPGQKNMMEIKYLIKCHKADENEIRILEELEELIVSTNYNSSIFIMLKIFMLNKLGELDRSKKYYSNVKDIIQDGMVKMQIEEILNTCKC